MQLNEAFEVFGFSRDETITAAQVRSRYKELMKQVHSDSGGSDYFAKQVNAARDLLGDYLEGKITNQNVPAPAQHGSDSSSESKDEDDPWAGYTQEEKDYWMDQTVLAWIESKTLRFKIKQWLRRFSKTIR